MRILSNLAIILTLLILIYVPTTIGQTSAYDIRSVETEIELNLDTKSVITQTIILLNGHDDLTEIIFDIYLKLSNLTIFVDSSLAASAINYDDGITTITIVPIQAVSANSEVLVVINGFFQTNFQEINHDEFQFFYDWGGNYLSNNISLVIVFPQGAFVSNDNGEYNIFPSNVIYSSDGTHVKAEWNELSNAESLNTKVFVQFSMETRLVSDNDNSKILNIVLSISLVLVTALLAYFVYLYWETKNHIQPYDIEKATKIVSTVKPLILSPTEIEILKTINQFEEGVPQSDLVKLLNISSARVSQNLAKFEDLGIIRKYKTGRQNIIIVDVELDLNNFEKIKDRSIEDKS